jgi:hypothetical protein
MIASKEIYSRAIAGGASVHVAFDLACRSYQAMHPVLGGAALRQAVADELDLPREDRISIEIGAFA